MMRVQDIQFILDKMDENQLRHSNNTACLSYAMGQAINCAPDELEALWFSGLLLESGKLIINNKLKNKVDLSFEDDFDILTKREKLANYTLYTQALLKSIENLERQIDFSPVLAIVDQAEENVDGTGFPRQLKARDINTLSKVLRISSYYDKCRLKGMSHNETCADMKEQSDKFFPARIIAPFIKCVVSNELQNDYCSERNYTIGQLTEEEKQEMLDLIDQKSNEINNEENNE